MECRRNDNLPTINTVGLGFKKEAILKSKDGQTKLNWGKHKEEIIRKKYAQELNNDEKLIQECISKNNLIDDFLNEEFCKEIKGDQFNHEYKITAVIASLCLGITSLSDVKLDGMSYPSIKNKMLAGPNWALTVNIADKYYTPVSFETFEIGKIERHKDEIKHSCALIYKSNNVEEGSGKINWNKCV